MYRHYVYELRNNTKDSADSVFYVGKGVNNRVSSHYETVKRKLANGEDITEEKELEIKELITSKDNVKVELQELIIGRYETAEQAFAVEATLIKWVYGRRLTNRVQGKHHYNLREKGDFNFDKDLDREDEAYGELQLRLAKEAGLNEAGEELRVRLAQYNIHTGPYEITMGKQDHAIWWTVPDTNFQIQIKLKPGTENVSLLARFNATEHYDEFIETMKVAGYLVSHRVSKNNGTVKKCNHPKEGAFASLFQLTNQNGIRLSIEEMETLQNQLNYNGTHVGGYGAYGIPRNKEQGIIRWLKDFQIRVKLAQQLMNNTLSDESKTKIREIIILFVQRPQSTKKIRRYSILQQP